MPCNTITRVTTLSLEKHWYGSLPRLPGTLSHDAMVTILS